jgi:hypothetical protein
MTVRGFFSQTHILRSVLAPTPVPLVNAFIYVSDLGLGAPLQFLVDSGADITVLHPHDSVRLLKTPEQWAAVRRYPMEPLSGAGHELPHYLVNADIVLEHEDGTLDSDAITLWIAEPDQQNWLQESLLGRDVLAGFSVLFEKMIALTLER